MQRPVRTPTFITQSSPGLGGHPAFDFTLSGILSGRTPVKVHFQSIVDLQRGVTAGYEALVRLPAALGTSTEECFRNAALRGKRFELEELVTCAVLQSKDILPANCFLSINVSVPFLLSRHWEKVLAGVADLSKVVIELRQDGLIADYDYVRSNLCLIRAMGGFVAVDEVGSGYASLQHIVEVKPNFIKLHANLVSECDSQPAKSVLIEMIGQAANRLDAWVIAEGVQTQSELHELLHLEVPLAQGNFLDHSHPQMRQLSAELATEIRSSSYKPNLPDCLAAYLEVCPSRKTQQEARMLLMASTASAVVVVDPWNRPVHIIERHALVGIRGVPDVMKVQISTDPGEALHRALTRPAATRFDPFAVIDAEGTLQGIIHVDRLSRILLDTASSRLAAVRSFTPPPTC